MDALDATIVMHREVHFGGKFSFMLDYYIKEGRGVNPEFEIARIRELETLEHHLNQNLATLLLSGPDVERVAEAKEAYRKLRALYEGKSSPSKKHPRLIADLILCEDDDAADAAVAAAAAEKSAIVPPLMELLRSEDFHDPLFPGYGLAPALAARCLGMIGDKRSIIALFESIGESDFLSDDLALEALKAIGEPAKTFLLKVMHARPLTYDNERAAEALLQFKEDPDVANACFAMLQTLDLKRDQLLATHLALACEGLADPKSRQTFTALAKKESTPSMLRRDIESVIKNWNL